MVWAWCVKTSIMFELLDRVYFTSFTNGTMIISKTLLTFPKLFLHLRISLSWIIPQILINPKFGQKPDRITHDSRMSEYKIEKLLNQEFPYLKWFCFSFTFCIYVHIFCERIYIWYPIWTYPHHLFVYVFQYTEMNLYFLV